MEFEVMSRQCAEQYSNKEDIVPTFIISISDAGSVLPNINYKNTKIRVSYFQFDDVDVGDTNCITNKQASTIVELYNLNKNNVEKIVVHCEAGVSRSAGVCAALMKIHTGDDMDIFSNARYCPNMTCYRKILEAYYGTYDEQEAIDKFAVNTYEWRKQEGLLDEE